ncbi:MAG: alkaline phosphatase family protein [Gemmatimonadota bacterium]
MSRRVFLLEFSGPTLEILSRYRDRLPALRELSRGARARLIGPLQPSATTSFATLLTGRDPGATGAFDSLRFPAGGYDRIPFDPGAIVDRTLFRHLSDAGRRVGLLNVPLLDPVPALNGFAVAGGDRVNERFAYPVEVGETLLMEGYRVPFGASYYPGREMAFYRHAVEVLSMRRRALRALFGGRPWDFGMLSLFVVGEVLHAFWRFYDPRHPRHRPLSDVFGDRDPLLELLIGIDGMLAEVVELTGPEGLVIAMGAWGHGLEAWRVHLNTVLHREGLLAFRKTAQSRLKRSLFRVGVASDGAERWAHRLNVYRKLHYGMSRGSRARVAASAFLSHDDVDWSRTKAVALGYLGQIHLNIRGHRPLGVIPAEDYASFRDDLATRLEGLRDPGSGGPVVERVWTKEELYRGPESTHAPDLVVQCREGYAANSGFEGRGRIVTPSPPGHSSDHQPVGFFLAGGSGIRSTRMEGRLADVAPTVLQALGVKPPADGDGRVLPIFT